MSGTCATTEFPQEDGTKSGPDALDGLAGALHHGSGVLLAHGEPVREHGWRVCPVSAYHSAPARRSAPCLGERQEAALTRSLQSLRSLTECLQPHGRLPLHQAWRFHEDRRPVTAGHSEKYRATGGVFRPSEVAGHRFGVARSQRGRALRKPEHGLSADHAEVALYRREAKDPLPSLECPSRYRWPVIAGRGHAHQRYRATTDSTHGADDIRRSLSRQWRACPRGAGACGGAPRQRMARFAWATTRR